MQVIEISRPGGPDVLTPAQRERPTPGAGEVRIRVRAAGVNRPDLMQRAGKYPPPPGASDLPGLEVAGEIDALGDNVSQWQLGDAVCALCNGGGYAQYVCVPAGQCLPKPAPLDWAQAAALPETYFTVWSNLFMRAQLASGQSLLVHGGASGIGTTALTLARSFGVKTFATAGSQTTLDGCRQLGAQAINYRDQDFVQVIDQATQGRGVDVVLDMIGGDYFARNLKVLAPEGWLVQIATQHGREVTLDLMTMMQKRLRLSGSTLRPQSAQAKAVIADQLRHQVWPRLDAGEFAPLIHARVPFEQASQAHRLLENGGHIGKIVLELA
ncbi:NAD(P)H-quinone oxidoreductase [Oleiagrimonas sp. C23AA]|uniref:NAD(P)H-quinone oxidoreductase n=1 Tax=Oleiagrimonas sp. C23AA TaxID=2719047 RepID=UPI001981F841|nr:NAD(P)H-quinone oxidoreductase [Oleiagrimonas sp. C23AA]